jgi:hypothetical protein
MEIIGEYVRTHLGNIGKVIVFDTDIESYITDNFKVFDEVDVYKHSKNIIDLIEDEDIVILEYKSPKYRERITRRFEVSKIGDDISFENLHCDFLCKVGDKKITDTICKNIKIKSIATKEQLSDIEYKVEE